MGFYTEPWQWWVSGIVFGLAGRIIFVMPAPILISNWFHTRKGIALGVAMSISGIGGAILSPEFTLFIQTFGRREAYLIAAVVMGDLVLPWTLFVFKLRPEDIGMRPYGWKQEDEEDESAAADEFGGIDARQALKTVPLRCMFLFAGLIA